MQLKVQECQGSLPRVKLARPGAAAALPMACCRGRCPQVSAPAGSSPGTPSHAPHGAARACSWHRGPCPVSPGAQVQELASLRGVTRPPALPAQRRSAGCFPGALRTRTQPLQYQATCPRWTSCTKTRCVSTAPPPQEARRDTLPCSILAGRYRCCHLQMLRDIPSPCSAWCVALPLAHPSLCGAGPGFPCHWARRGAGPPPGSCSALQSLAQAANTHSAATSPWQALLPRLPAAQSHVPRSATPPSLLFLRRALAVLQCRTLRGKAEPRLPSPRSPPPARPCPRGTSTRPAARSTPALLPLAPLCFSRMLAEQEERRKSQLQMSGNLFIKRFFKLLTQKKPAEDIKKHYIEKVSAATAVLPTRPWPAAAMLQVPAPPAGAPGQRHCCWFEQGAGAQSGEAAWSTGRRGGAAGGEGLGAGQAGAGALQPRSRHSSVPGSLLADRCCTRCSSSEGCTRGW